MHTADLFTFPWPGPGNSEGPVDPEGWTRTATPDPEPTELPVNGEAELVSVTAWAGPGDSEG